MERLSNCGHLSRPDGSAFYTEGETTIIAVVYGPVECKQNKALIDKASIEMYYRPKIGVPSINDKLTETILRNICEAALVTAMYPRSSVVVVVQEMENGGDIIAPSINAVCLALLVSGIDMKYMVAAVTCCMDSDGDLIVNPSKAEMNASKASFVFVFDSLDGNIVASHTTGIFSLDNFENALSLCKRNSGNVFEYFRSEMKANFDK